MNKIYYIICIIFFACVSHAQETPLATSQRVADYVLNHHNHKISLAEDGHSHIESYYQEWRYVNGVLGLAMLNLADVTQQKRYETFVKDNFDFFFDKKIQTRLEKEYHAGIRDNAWRRFFSMSSLDDCGAMGAALSELARRYKDKNYEDYLNRITTYILKQQQRISPNGIFCRGDVGDRTLWLDDLYMSTSFLVHQGSRQGQSEDLLHTAAQQFLLFDSLLYDHQAGIYWHCFYYDKSQESGIAHWGRANGWAFLAQTLILDRLPTTDAYYSKLLSIFRKRIRSLCTYQDEKGMWHQLLDKPASYPETSCTAMFITSIAHAINKGWLDESYKDVVKSAWQALSNYITPEGQLQNVCMGTGISRALPFYYTRPTPLNDAHGLGAVIMAGIEINKLLHN